MKSGQYDQLIRNAVLEHMPAGYDWRLYKAQIFQESSFNPRALSPAGARGLAQIMPVTWDQWKRPEFDDPFDPMQSLMTGARYMGICTASGNHPGLRLTAFALPWRHTMPGPGHILSAQKLSGDKLLYGEIIAKLPDVSGNHSTETINYVRKILGYWVSEVVTA